MYERKYEGGGANGVEETRKGGREGERERKRGGERERGGGVHGMYARGLL